MSVMPQERNEPEPVVQMLIAGVPVSLRQRFKVLGARKNKTMQVLELRALEIGLEILEGEDDIRP